MSEFSEINGVASANIVNINGVAKADISSIHGLTIPDDPTTLFSIEFTSSDGFGNTDGSSATLPEGWAKADSGNTTVYSGTTDSDLSGNQNTRGWLIGYGGTGSSGTGPGGGMTGGIDASDGIWSIGSTYR